MNGSIRQSLDHVFVVCYRGNLLRNNKKYDEAISSYRLAINFRPTLAREYIILQRIPKLSSVYSHFSTDFIYFIATLLSLTPRKLGLNYVYFHTFLEAYLSLGDCLATSNRYAEAERVLKKCLVLKGSRVKDIRTHVAAKKSCALRLGRMYATAGKHQYAVNVFELAIRSEESPSSQVNRLFFVPKL